MSAFNGQGRGSEEVRRRLGRYVLLNRLDKRARRKCMPRAWPKK